MLPSCCIP